MTEYIIDYNLNKRCEEVVRCRDCKKFDPDFKHDWEEMWWCKGLCHYTPPDGFCSFGKRREA